MEVASLGGTHWDKARQAAVRWRISRKMVGRNANAIAVYVMDTAPAYSVRKRHTILSLIVRGEDEEAEER